MNSDQAKKLLRNSYGILNPSKKEVEYIKNNFGVKKMAYGEIRKLKLDPEERNDWWSRRKKTLNAK